MLGIFYYPWYGGPVNPESKWRHWKDGGHNPPATWNSRYKPWLGLYDSFDQDVIQTHMYQIKEAGIDFVIWSWWGRDSFADHALSKFWSEGAFAGLKHCIYYEKEWLNNVPQDEIKADINYIKTKYAGANTNPNPNFLRIDNKPVIFVYNATPTAHRGDIDYQVKLAEKWNAVRKLTACYTVLKISKGWQNFKALSNSWHQYAPSTPYEKVSNYSSFVSPGWWSPTEAKPRLPRDIARFEANLQTMKADSMPIKLIQTFNEWTEGTSIEPAEEFDSQYIDAVGKCYKQ